MNQTRTRTNKADSKPLKMNLQFFAEPGEPEEKPETNPQEENGNGSGNEPPTLEALMARITSLEADNAKMKREKDKASSDAADWKKKYNATLTDAQIAAQQKADKEAQFQEEFNAMKRENTINKLAKNFLKLNYPEDKAEEAAAAQYDGDSDAMFRIQSEVQQSLIKKAEQEWYKTRPQTDTGAGNGEEEDAFLKGFNSVPTPYRR